MTALEEIKKALAAAEQFIVNGVELGYIRMPNPETPDSAHDTLPMIRQANTALESLQNEAVEAANALQVRNDTAEAEVARLLAEIDRKSSMPGDHRYWEGRYRDEAAENEKLREALTPFGTVGAVIDGPFGPALFAENDMAFQSGCAWSENGERKTLTWGDFRRARIALASTGGEHHGN